MDQAPLGADLAATTRKQVENVDPNLLARFPVDGYIEALDALDEYAGYSAVPARVDGWSAEIKSRHGADVLEDYHRLLLLALIERFEVRVAAREYPESILTLFRHYLRGVVAQMPRNPRGFYLHENDRFAKDLAVCRQKLVPCGAQLVDRRSGVPRSSAWSGGFAQLFRLPLYFARRIGGFRPLYQLHMDPRLMLEFNPPGWERCYLRIAELLVSDPAVLGVCGTSWWFDPQLEEVSPRIAFIRTLPESNGARVFYRGEDEVATQSALANSKQRQELYVKGHYRPANYLLVWAREDLLTWAARVGK